MALVLLIAIEGISALLHPFPPGTEQTRESMARHVANYPAWVLFLLGGVGWALTALIASFLATRFGAHRHPAHGVGVGMLFMAAAVFNIAMLPYPIWFISVDVIMLPMGSIYWDSPGPGKRQISRVFRLGMQAGFPDP